MKIGNKEYPVTGQVRIKGTDIVVPLVDIPQMSDEEWQRGAEENAIKNYRRVVGCEPKSAEIAVAWQREYIASLADKKAPSPADQ